MFLNLREEYTLNSKIENFYGRNIYSNTSLVNHYIQSTAVDTAMIAFYNFMSKLETGVDLIGIIHDAILIDVHPDKFDEIENTYMMYEDTLDIKLPVKVERIS